MRIANWSVPNNQANPTGIRLNLLKPWLAQADPPIDVLALQKVGFKEEFPQPGALREMGYRGAVNGREPTGDFGVAILSRSNLPEPHERCRVLPGTEKDGARLLTVEIAGLTFSSVYAPYGGKDGPDIGRRVRWLQCLRSHVSDPCYTERDSLLCGDFNVKPKSDDPCLNKGYSRVEQDEFEELLKLGFVDLFDAYRQKHPETGTGRTFWFTEGTPTGYSRLHLAVASRSVAKRLRRVWVDTEFAIPRGAAPLIVDLDYDL